MPNLNNTPQQIAQIIQSSVFHTARHAPARPAGADLAAQVAKQASHVLADICVATEQNTGSRAALSELADACTQLSHNSLVPPGLRRQAQLQAKLVTHDFMRGPCRNTNLPPTTSAIEGDYEDAVKKFIPQYFAACQVGVDFLCYPGDLQRSLVNLGADAALVGADGQVGQIAHVAPRLRADLFVNVVHTSSSAQLETMLAQGPKAADEVSRLLAAATNFARRHGCSQVVFINAATDQVPSFAPAVEALPSASGAHYLEFGDWPDGTIPTAAQRRPLIEKLVDLVHTIEAHGSENKSLVVVNCHMGLDRSGIINGLLQLAIDHRQSQDPQAAAASVLHGLKQARMRAITAQRRFTLFHNFYRDLREALGMQLPIPSAAASA